MPCISGIEWLNSIKIAVQRREAIAIKVDEPLETANQNVDPSTEGKCEKIKDDITEILFFDRSRVV